jgi:hypothetical protein
LFAHREAALEILTSDFDARPAEIPSWLKSRWREENFLKYASESYGIGKTATNRRDQPNSKIAANPARQPATAMSSAADILSGFCTGGYLDNPG